MPSFDVLRNQRQRDDARSIDTSCMLTQYYSTKNKVASEDQIIEALLSLDNMKIAYDAIKVLELVRNVKIVYFDTESMNFINVLLKSTKQKSILNS